MQYPISNLQTGHMQLILTSIFIQSSGNELEEIHACIDAD